MATLTGTAGSVARSSTDGAGGTGMTQAMSWSLNVETNEIDTSIFGNSWAGYDGGVSSWSGSFTAQLDLLNPDIWIGFRAGTKQEITFWLGTATKYYGTCIITSEPIEHTFDGIAMITWSFQGVGALAQA